MMDMPPILLEELRVVGGANEPAALRFKPGFNLVTGASNTGKSYALQCIDFMLGAKKLPKALTEAAGYVKVFLQLRHEGKQVWTLERALKGGDFRRYKCAIDEIDEDAASEILQAKANAKSKKSNISRFILELFGAAGAKIRTNNRDDTNNLTFRRAVHFFVVSETQIIQEASPIHTSETTDRTFCECLFNYLLTGTDDSALVAMPKYEVARASQSGQIKLLGRLIAELKAKIASRGDLTKTVARLAAVDAMLDEISESLSANSGELRVLQEARQAEWKMAQEHRSRAIVIRELLTRFDLLRQQYESDLGRLEFIGEGEHIVSQLEPIDCPWCGQKVEGHRPEGVCITGTDSTSTDLGGLQEACQEEARKLEGLIGDLSDTVSSLNEELSALLVDAALAEAAVEAHDKTLRENLRPAITSQRERLNQATADRKSLGAYEADVERLQDLEKARSTVEDQKPQKAESRATELDHANLLVLCLEIEKLLKEWNLPVSRVTFSDADMDIVVDGKLRQSNGQGVRAVLYAAFSIALLRLREKVETAIHPGFLLLDSPLTTLKEGTPAPGDEVGEEIHRGFFKSLAATPSSQQIIVFENKEPDGALKEMINLQEFVGARGQGRSGFYPTTTG